MCSLPMFNLTLLGCQMLLHCTCIHYDMGVGPSVSQAYLKVISPGRISFISVLNFSAAFSVVSVGSDMSGTSMC